MHLLQLLPGLDVGGVERGVLDLAKGLIARGHRVSVISAGGALVEPLVALGATHHALPVHAKSLRTMGACVPAVADVIRHTGVDLVHARSRVPAWIGWAAARQTQRPFLTTAHGFYRPHPGSQVMAWGRCVIAPSQALARYLTERFHVPSARLRVIPRGVDLEQFRFQPPAPVRNRPWRLGIFSRLSPLKGQQVALRAVARLVRRGFPVTLCLAGDAPGSPARRSLEDLMVRLRLREEVEWLGVRQDMPSLLASVDIVLVPSTYPESFGRSVIEANAVGRPVIASRLGALEELIDDRQNGMLVPPRDPVALADAVEQLITYPSLRRRCIVIGRHKVQEEWTLDRMVERTLAVYEECVHGRRVIIWKLSALGDVILSTPSLRAIRRQFSKGHVSVVVGRSAYEVVARCPYVDDVLIYDPSGKDRGAVRQLAFIRRLSRIGFDLSIDLQNSRASHLMAWLAGIPVRVGYRRRYGWLLNQAVRLPRVAMAPVAHQHHLLREAGITLDGERLELWPGPLDEQRARELLGGEPRPDQALVGMHPGGSGRWKTKRWDLDRWARLCDALAVQHIRVVVTGGPEEQPLGEALRRVTSQPPLILIGQTSLMELACVIKRCRAFLAHDSLALHVATAMGTPTVALFGPTDPRRHLASSFTGLVIKKDVFCSPCYSPRCRTITHACMGRISVEEVLRAVLSLLADRVP